MKKLFSEWIGQFDEDTRYDIEDMIGDSSYDIASVEMGCHNNEHQANEYFESDRYADFARIASVDDSYVLYTDNEAIEWVVYDNKSEAIQDMDKLGNTLLPTIQTQIDEFKSELDAEMRDKISVKAKREFNSSGSFYSFNIYFEDDLLIDGIFSLNADGIINDVTTLNNLKKHLQNEYGIDIISIEKIRHHFDRYYELILFKDGYSITKKINICGTTQGRTKKTVDYIEMLDIDEILEELAE